MKLQDVCELFTDGDWIESKDQSDEGIRLVQTGNIGIGKYLEKEGKEKYISKDTFKSLNCTEIYPGDVLISRLPEPVGRGCIIPEKNERMITAVDCTICRVNEKIVDKKYFCYYLQSPTYYNQLEQSVTGTTRKRISRKNLGNVEMSIPEKEKQIEIINVLDKVTTLIEERKEELQKLDELIKARFVELFGDVQREEKYPGIPLRKLCSTISGGTPSTKYPEYYKGDIPWISTVSLGPNHIDGSTAKGYITEEAIVNSATKLIPAGNILFGTRVGVGKSSLNDVDICTNQDIVAIVGNDETKYSRLFIKHVFDAYQPYFDSIKKGATILGITGEDLKDSLIPEVPIELQKEYENFVEQVDKSKVAVQKALEVAQLLFDSLMQKYFG